MKVRTEFIRFWRKRNELSQASAAALAGVSRATWIRWESGAVDMHPGYMLTAMCGAGEGVDDVTVQNISERTDQGGAK